MIKVVPWPPAKDRYLYHFCKKKKKKRKGKKKVAPAYRQYNIIPCSRMLLSTSIFYNIAFVASLAPLSLSIAIEKPPSANLDLGGGKLSLLSSPSPTIAKRDLRDLPFFQNLEYNEATPLAIDRNPAVQENLQEQRQLQFELAVFGATEIARFALELRPDDIVYRLFFGNANAEQQATIRREFFLFTFFSSLSYLNFFFLGCNTPPDSKWDLFVF